MDRAALRSISAARVAALVGDFDRSPAYAGLADALALLIGDGRIAPGHPAAERARAHRRARRLPDDRHARVRRAARRRVRRGAAGLGHLHPGARRPRPVRTTGRCSPGPATTTAIDLNCAAPSAPPELAAAYAEAGALLPAYLGGHGYFPAGLPELQAAIARDLRRARAADRPRADHGDPGRAGGGRDRRQGAHRPRRPGAGRVPGLPQRHGGAAQPAAPGSRRRPSTRTAGTSTPCGAALRQTAPRLAYLIPDFQNPTGPADERRGAGDVRRARAAPRARSPSSTRRTRRSPLEGQADAAAVRGALPRHDHHRQRQQELLGRPAARLGAGAARPGRPR